MQGGNFTNKSQQALLKAQNLAKEKGQKQVDAVHLLHSLLNQDESIVLTLLEKLGIDLKELKKETESALGGIPNIVTPNKNMGQFYLTQDMGKVLAKAKQESMQMGDKFVSVEHLFLALLSTNTNAKGIMEEVNESLTYQAAKDALKELRGNRKVTDPSPETKYQAIEKYAINLTEKAKKGNLDPVIGREEEIRRIMQVLSRRKKNNPVLIGEAGVGKTAIAEGLARKIASGQVPESLKGKKLISLDLGAMVAGTRYRGEFENRIKALLKEVKEGQEKYLLFIDELHTLVGAGSAEGAIDASNLLKPALAQGELRAIGATTLKEYQKHIEEDQALERRFQPVYVEEPSIEDTISILRGIKEKYELHHGVKIKDSALVASAELSARYINDRFLPDKSIDLMDEAMSLLRLEIESEPADLEELKKKIQKLEVEKQAIKEEDNKKSKKRLKVIEKKLANLQEDRKELEAKWKSERKTILKIKNLKKELEKARFEVEKEESRANLQKVAQIKYGKIPELEKELNEAEEKLARFQKERPILKEEVTEEDVAEVVSRWTGIPVTKLLEEEAKKLQRMEETLSERVIGQDNAIEAVSDAIRRSRAGIAEEDKPMGSFIFLGPTGVGKTETAKALAEFLFNNEDAMIRLDMSEYMEKYSTSKMIGSPPGYVGHDEGGQLTEKIRRRPYSVVLLDEIEKAHPEIFNMLLQILEDGRLTDAKGRTASFKNAILIMTSNVGSEQIAQMGELGFSAKDKKVSVKDKVMDSLKEEFRPEFLNRIDDIIIFNHLNKKQIKKIVELELTKVKKRLNKKGISINLTEKVKKILAKEGFDRELGARPLKRTIQKRVLNPLAMKIVIGEVKEKDNIKVKSEKGEITFEKKKQKKKAKKKVPSSV